MHLTNSLYHRLAVLSSPCFSYVDVYCCAEPTRRVAASTVLYTYMHRLPIYMYTESTLIGMYQEVDSYIAYICLGYNDVHLVLIIAFFYYYYFFSCISYFLLLSSSERRFNKETIT